MNDFFTLSSADAIAHLQLNRPERLNTMAPPFFPALRDAVRTLHDTGEARVLVISSTGRHFCAGMALDVFGADDAFLTTATPRARLRRSSARSRAAASAARSTWPPPATSACAAPMRSSPCRRSTSA